MTAGQYTPVRILYLGLPLGALCLSRAGLAPVAAGLGPLDLPGRRRVRRVLGARGCLLLGMPDLGDSGVRRALAETRPDAVLSWFWPRRIPEEILALASRGAFGTHPSLLPRWRGPDPYFWAIRSGDRETGVTLHRLEPEYDTGAIVAQRRVVIADEDDAWSLARRLDRPALELLVECARRLASGDPLEGVPQDDAHATSAHAPGDAELAIDWRATVDDILRLVRAASPEPGAGATLGDSTVEVVEAGRWEGELPGALQPAEALRTAEGPAVRAADGAVLVRRVRTDDGRVLVGGEVCRLLTE